MTKESKTGGRTTAAMPYRGLLVIIAPVLLIALICIAIIYYFVLPAPPHTLLMSTGTEGGAYSTFGKRYQQILDRAKVHVELLASSGSVENLKRLGDKSFRVDAGFVQAGMGSTPEAKNLVSLGAICYSPLWVFYRGHETFDDLFKLNGKKIAIGLEGSGVRRFAMELLRASNAAEPPTLLLDLSSAAASKALLEGGVDAVMIFSTEDNAFVQELLHSDKVKLMNFKQAEAYSRRFPALSHVILPRGILDLSKEVPGQDIHLLASTTSLVVRRDLDPALIYLLMDAAAEIHSAAGWVNKRGEFPSHNELDFPSSEYAQRFYKSGRPFLINYLPFWVAVFVDRMILILVPIAVLLLPLTGSIPLLYGWRNRRKFYRWYGELKNLEFEVIENSEPKRVIEYQGRLDQIEASINRIRVPLAFFGEVYKLKEHLDLVRRKIDRSGQPSREGNP
jgi:TRAP-type uncharacterized transport system substrate-binding protein